jgi:O-antigen ligase
VVNSASYYSNGFKYIHSHNTYVQIWIETGILGIISFLAALINWFKRSSAWIVDKDCPNDLKNIIMAGVAGIIGVLVFGLVDYIWFYPRVMVVFWAVIGVTIAAVKIASDEAYGEKGEDSLT